MFRVGSKTKNTPKLSDPTSQEQKFGPMEFTLGVGSEIWKNTVALLWHHFPVKSWHSLPQANAPLILRNECSSLGPISNSENKVHEGVPGTGCMLMALVQWG